MEINRICKPGWKNCKMPELRAQIAELTTQIEAVKDIAWECVDEMHTDRLRRKLKATERLLPLHPNRIRQQNAQGNDCNSDEDLYSSLEPQD